MSTLTHSDNFSLLSADFNIAADVEADLNYDTRVLLDFICASVENIADDFSADVALFPELSEAVSEEGI
jgi:hypothetical protein